MGNYIQYVDYNPSPAITFFKQKQANTLMLAKKENFDSNEARFNAILAKAQEGVSKITNEYVSENQLSNALVSAMESANALSGDLEKMAGSINSYFAQADKAAAILRQDYESGYDEFQQIINTVLQSGRVSYNKKDLENVLKNLSPQRIQQEFRDVANPLGWIGELSGLALLSNVADELLKTSFKNIPGVKVEIANTGKERTFDKQTLTTDNILIIRQGNKILYTLNLSNKLNTAYTTKAKTTKRAIKLRTTTVNSFLKEHDDWAQSLYNIVSYHWDTSKDKRVDFLNLNSGLARQTLGTQILYDHVFGTKGTFSLEDDLFKDEVHLIAYGTKIIASSSILKNALFTKAMKDKKKLIMAQVDRSKWFEKGDEQGPTYIINEFDAEKKIAAFNIIYNQTLQIE